MLPNWLFIMKYIQYKLVDISKPHATSSLAKLLLPNLPSLLTKVKHVRAHWMHSLWRMVGVG
jgi:hypothetical protein